VRLTLAEVVSEEEFGLVLRSGSPAALARPVAGAETVEADRPEELTARDYIMFTTGVRLIPSADAGLISVLESVLAPILAFTTDEAWEFVPPSAGSVHENEWKRKGLSLSPDEIRKWDWLKQWREMLLPELEKARQAKIIGKALDAKAEIVIPQVQVKYSDAEMLHELVNVSNLKISVGETASFVVSKADGQKCEPFHICTSRSRGR